MNKKEIVKLIVKYQILLGTRIDSDDIDFAINTKNDLINILESHIELLKIEKIRVLKRLEYLLSFEQFNISLIN